MAGMHVLDGGLAYRAWDWSSIPIFILKRSQILCRNGTQDDARTFGRQLRCEVGFGELHTTGGPVSWRHISPQYNGKGVVYEKV